MTFEMTSARVARIALLAMALGCVKNRTEIVLGMATDLTASTPLSSVRLQVYSLPEDVVIADQALPISGTVNELYELPGTYAVYSASGSADRFRALLTATDNNSNTLVVRSAVLSLVPGKTLFARLGVVSACEGMTDCGAGETCIEGHCASEEIDSSRLPGYKPGMENEVDCASPTTFVDTSTKQPLKMVGTSCASGESCLEGVCLSPLPGDGGADRSTDGPASASTPQCLVNSDCSGEVLTGVAAVSAGQSYACALLTGGTVQCWGDDSYGELGNGSTSTSPVPTPVAVGGLSGVTAISAAYHHTCALLAGGTVACWGDDSEGQLGNGSTSLNPIPTPVAVSGLSGVAAIAVGFTHTCALLTGGTVQCWGDNTFGQLGNGSTTNSSLPVTVSGLSGVKAVSAGFYFTCALLTGGTVQCWGDDEGGSIGNGSTTTSVPTPVAVSGLSNVTAISAGATHACALLTGGMVQCWGTNAYGQLGNGSTTNSSVPVTVSGLSGATAISSDDNHGCAVLTGGTVACWGDNQHGELGNGTTSALPVSTPVAVSGLSSVAAVSASQSATCVVSTGGALQCWGDNRYGELGNGSVSTTPVTKPAAGGGTPGLICALGYCVSPCAVSSDCPDSERCVVVGSDSDGGTDGAAGVRATACQASETVACQASSTCRTPLVCGGDEQCRDACATNVDCPASQVCTSQSHVCADPALDKDYSPATNDFVAGTGGSGGRGGAVGLGAGGSGGTGATVGAGAGGSGGRGGAGGLGAGGSGGGGTGGAVITPTGAGGAAGGGGPDAGAATCVNGATITPTTPLITDFSDAVPGTDYPGEFTFGSTSGEVGSTGRIASGTVGTLSLTNGALNFAAAVEAPTTSVMYPYNGVGLFFGGFACVDASQYTGVAFTISGIAGTCQVVFSFVDANHLAATDPSRGLCDASTCFPSVFSVTSSTTMVAFNATPMTAGEPTATVDVAKLAGVQWELELPSGSTTGCTGSITLDNIEFY
jgi:alpha-tubulin suppressor-like RCC1 family protein